MSWDNKKISDIDFFNSKKYEKMKEKIKNYEIDAKQDARYRSQKCKCCMYLNNDLVGFSAMTVSNCKMCDKEIVNSSSLTDKLCFNCAAEKFLCVRCGGTL